MNENPTNAVETTMKGNTVIVPGTNLLSKLVWLKSNAQSNCNYIIEISTDESIENEYISYDDKNNITITLKGIGLTRVISLNQNGYMFIVGSGITLVLDNNITLKGKRNNTHFLVGVDGVLIMNKGSAITGNIITDTDLPFGCIYIFYDGSFIMNGGTISNNSANRGVGGVRVEGTFIMRDGEIYGNTGGGVLVWEHHASFDMSGGTIYGNRSKASGGVLVCKDAVFNMSGGIITNNRAELGGGGIAIESASFTKTGGVITGYLSDMLNGNVVNEYGTPKINQGHAVAVVKNSKFIKFKDTTVMSTDNLSYNTNNDVATGSWDIEKNSVVMVDISSNNKRKIYLFSGIGAFMLGVIFSTFGVLGFFIGAIAGWFIGRKIGQKIMDK